LGRKNKMRRNPNLPKMEELIKGRIYKLECRNLLCGVWNGVNAFIGIRHKWGDEFLDTEYHWDFDDHYGTVENAEDTNHDIPKDFVLDTDLGIKDNITGEWIERKWDENNKFVGWYYIEDNEIATNVRPVGIPNKELFNYLKNYIDKNYEYLQYYIGEKEIRRC
jgi:hypothetical protein